MYTLGIETSCDETAAAVFDGRAVISDVVASSLEFHSKFGGVIPEIASRCHLEAITGVIKDALSKAKIGMKELGLLAVTMGPGLVGSLLVGVSMARSLSSALKIRLLGVNHLKAHLYAGILSSPRKVRFPCVGLVVSGGHTGLVFIQDKFKFKLLGETTDDAAGEAFDKAAKILGLGYPGGPIIEKVAAKGDENAVRLPRSYLGDSSLDFSFSGLKTAVLYYVKKQKGLFAVNRSPFTGKGKRTLNARRSTLNDIAASFQKAVVDVLVDKTMKAAAMKDVSDVIVGGGVAANSSLRNRLFEEGRRRGLTIHIPPKRLCVDNAAMTAALGHMMYRRNLRERKGLGPVADLGFK